MKISQILLALSAATSSVYATTAAYQQFAAYFGSECADEGENPILLSAMYSRTCDDYQKQCFDFPESSTSGSLTCTKSLTNFPKIVEEEDYFTIRVFQKSVDCSGTAKSQGLQLRQNDACIPNSMGEEPSQWLLATCGDGEHYLAVCDDEDCSSCQDPYVFQDNVCYQTEGLQSSTDKFSLKFSCTTLKPGRTRSNAITTEADAKECQKKSLKDIPQAVLKSINPSSFARPIRQKKNSKVIGF